VSFIFFVIILKNIVVYINELLSDYLEGKFESNISNFVFSKFINSEKLFFDRTNKGYIRLVLEYSSTIASSLNLFQKTTTVVFSVIIGIAIMFTISWRLTVVVFLVFPFLHYSLKSIIDKLGKLATQKNIIQIKLNENIFDILSCIPLVKAYSRERETEKIYASLKEQLRKLNFQSARISNLISPLHDIIVMGFLLFLMLIIVLFFTKSSLFKIPVFFVFFFVARRTLLKFDIFNSNRKTFKEMKPKLNELLKNFDDKDKFSFAEGKKIFERFNKKIDFIHLNFSYIEGMCVLKDINFSIEKGKTIAIVGPTGAGKTTLISLIARFYDCSPSSIIIDGVDIREFTLKSLREHIALVSQEVWLFNDTLRNNLIFGLDRKISDEELIDITKKSRLYDLVTQLPYGLDTNVGDRAVKLSGGEKQRVAIARGLLKNPEILILDEACSSLDSNTEKLIQEAIGEAAKERTVILISHKLSTIKHADKIAVIDNGYFIEEGCFSELIEKKGKFYEYWEAQKLY